MPSDLLRSVGFLLAALVIVVGWPTALGHGDGEPFIHVPLDHVDPGTEFPIIAADLDPSSSISIALVHRGGSVELGRVTTDSEGHFESSLVMPATVPHGYAQMVASNRDSGEVSAWILVGPREGMGPSPGSPTDQSGTSLLTDPSVIVLAGAVGGSLLALAWLMLGRVRRNAAATHSRSRTRSKPRAARGG